MVSWVASLHRVDVHPAVDLRVFERTVEPLQMLAQPKGLLPKAPRHLKNHVPIHQRAVENRNPRLRLGDELAVEIHQSLRHNEFLLAQSRMT